MFNPVAPYRFLLPTMCLFMAYIANPDFFVCGCRTWICLDITRFYEEQRVRMVGLPKKSVNRDTIAGDERFTAVCNRRDSSTACRMCRLDQYTIVNTYLNNRKHNKVTNTMSLNVNHHYQPACLEADVGPLHR